MSVHVHGNHDGGGPVNRMKPQDIRSQMEENANRKAGGPHGGHHGGGDSPQMAAEILKATKTISDALGYDIEDKVAELYKQYEGDALTTEMQKLSAEIIMDLSEDLANEPNNTELYNAAATMMRMGIHSNADADGGTGTHGINEAGSPDESRAYTLAHMFQAGNDTQIGNDMRQGGATVAAMQTFDGAALKDYLKGGTLTDVYTSNPDKYLGGAEVADHDGTIISSMWGASGDARASAGRDDYAGAQQNVNEHNQKKAWKDYNS